jgi:hypothetical protein
MKKGVISYQVDNHELTDLTREGLTKRLSIHAVAREWMRSWQKVRETMEELLREVSKLRRESSQLRTELANACMILLCRAGKDDPKTAERWVLEHLVKK